MDKYLKERLVCYGITVFCYLIFLLVFSTILSQIEPQKTPEEIIQDVTWIYEYTVG